MPTSFGTRGRTRHLFSKGFRKHGMPGLSTYLVNYRLGDIVDIKCNPAIQKGMPFKHYHGKTGRVWNVTKRSVGVVMNKQVGNRILAKRIHVRVEHVSKSASRQSFLERSAKNDKIKSEAAKRGEKIVTKRQPKGPVPAHFVKTKGVEQEYLQPIPFSFIF